VNQIYRPWLLGLPRPATCISIDLDKREPRRSRRRTPGRSERNRDVRQEIWWQCPGIYRREEETGRERAPAICLQANRGRASCQSPRAGHQNPPVTFHQRRRGGHCIGGPVLSNTICVWFLHVLLPVGTPGVRSRCFGFTAGPVPVCFRPAKAAVLSRASNRTDSITMLIRMSRCPVIKIKALLLFCPVSSSIETDSLAALLNDHAIEHDDQGTVARSHIITTNYPSATDKYFCKD
jgi:hypothetical protein